MHPRIHVTVRNLYGNRHFEDMVALYVFIAMPCTDIATKFWRSTLLMPERKAEADLLAHSPPAEPGA